jgi:hypothetical protein
MGISPRFYNFIVKKCSIRAETNSLSICANKGGDGEVSAGTAPALDLCFSACGGVSCGF